MPPQGKLGLLTLLDRQIQELFAWLKDIPARLRDLGDTNYNLGMRFLAEGKVADAKFRFQLALRFKSNYYLAWYQLGNCLIAQNKPAEAMEAFRKALQLKPDYEEARFMLALTDPHPSAKLLPHTYPVPLAIRVFTALAPKYEDTQLSQHYCSPLSLFEALKPLLPQSPVEEALDIGCGTGLLGDFLRPHAGQLIGIDVTPAMTERAIMRYDSQGLRIYDDVVTDDLRAYMHRLNRPLYNLIAGAGVMSYVGGLAAVFDGVGGALQPGGLFAFTTDPWPGEAYGFIRDRERFGHSEGYVRQQAQRVGLTVERIAPCKLSQKEEGLVCILRKPA